MQSCWEATVLASVAMPLSCCHHSLCLPSLCCHCLASLHFLCWLLPWPLVGCHCCHDHDHWPPTQLPCWVAIDPDSYCHCYFTATLFVQIHLCSAVVHAVLLWWSLTDYCLLMLPPTLPTTALSSSWHLVTALDRCCKLHCLNTLIQLIHCVWCCCDTVAIVFATSAVLLWLCTTGYRPSS